MKKSLIRVIALSLALTCVAGAVGAVNLKWDLNNDGKTNVWDLQLAVTGGKSDAEKSAALTEALNGQVDELHPNAEGQYEIWSMLGINNLIRKAEAGASFKLMADIDLQGMAWTPLLFAGNFDGNGHTISNVKITEDVLYKNAYDMGFFSCVTQYTKDGATVQSQISNLHLENVDLVATENAQYMGLVAGSNRGVISNCTATGSITDTRTQLPKSAYVGALVGRNADSTPAGCLVKGSDLLTATAGSDNSQDKVTGISAKLAIFLTPVSYPETAKAKPARTLGGIAGYSDAVNLDTSMLWQDISGSIDYQSKTEQSRRQTVVDKMYTMGTVKWTPSETVASLKDSGGPSHTHSNLFVKGYTYIGMPYIAAYNGSYERFMSVMQPEKDAEGRYVTVTGLEDGVKYASGAAIGACKYMGNNCSMAVGWAWAASTPSRVSDSQNGAVGSRAFTMVPNDHNTKTYGVLAVGGYQTLPTDTDKYPDASDAQDTIDLIDLNGGAAGMAEFYARASRGDALVYVDREYNEGTDSYNNVNAHVRLLSYDPVIIRKHTTEIDLDKSYVITHEQGDGLYDGKTLNGKYPTIKDIHNHPAGESCAECDKYSAYRVKATSWRINHKYTLNVLLTKSGYDASDAKGERPGCGFGYVPSTIRAFSQEGQLATPYFAEYTNQDNYHPVQWPNSGWFYCNYLNVSATMVIKDTAGNEVYHETAYMVHDEKLVGFATIKLEREFPDAAENLVAGQTYVVTLTATDSTGRTNTVKENVQFTYAPA